MKRPTVAEILQRQLLNSFASGYYSPGQKLPSEQQLAEMFEVSRASVREALQSLRNLGMIDVRPGRGSYLKHTEPADVVRPSILAGLMSPLTALDLFEARGTIEPTLAAFAAKRATPAELSSMEAFIDEYRVALSTRQRVSELSATFHLRVARLAHSPVLTRCVESLLEILAVRGEFIEDQPGFLEWEYQSHVAVFEAIKSGDARAASAEMMSHLVASTNRYLEASEEQGAEPLAERLGTMESHQGFDLLRALTAESTEGR
jgi:GntR family transcriptional regulator, transcriptional repressor for pyruvate dehydrogenase complex